MAQAIEVVAKFKLPDSNATFGLALDGYGNCTIDYSPSTIAHILSLPVTCGKLKDTVPIVSGEESTVEIRMFVRCHVERGPAPMERQNRVHTYLPGRPLIVRGPLGLPPRRGARP